jgi:hypothetical protein
MTIRTAAILLGIAVAALPVCAAAAPLPRPKAGKVEIMPIGEIKPGMKGTAWTVFQGTEPEPVPVEIIGRWKNQSGPKQDVILAKMSGKAARTFVAGGMSGSPVYIDGKLIGAVALRVGQFSVDAICGITPIEQMLEINDFDASRPADSRAPGRFASLLRGSVSGELQGSQPIMVPIEAPVGLAGFTDDTIRRFGPIFQQMGVTAVQSGAAGAAIYANKPAPGWEHALNPGDTVAAVLVDGDMGVSGLGTVTYNDGKRVLAFGHPFFNLGPVSMPMSKGEVLMTLASPLQPNKIANATEIVGALLQDRHSGIMGKLGAESEMIPVSVKVRSVDGKDAVRREKDFRFNVFVSDKWTPYLMTLTLYNSLSELNEFAEETTYRLTGKVEMNGQPGISLSNMQASGETPMPAPVALAGWWGDKFNRLYLNNVKTPDVKSVSVTVDLLAERRVAAIENAWIANPEVRAGDDVPVKVSLRPYRGDSIVREFNVHLPAGLAKGDHRVVLSDADSSNRMRSVAGMADRFIDLPETVSLLNQERSNNRLYVSLVDSSPTAYFGDKTMPSLPASALNVMQAGRASNRSLITSPETATEQMSLPFDYVVTGSYSLRIHVK